MRTPQRSPAPRKNDTAAGGAAGEGGAAAAPGEAGASPCGPVPRPGWLIGPLGYETGQTRLRPALLA